MPLRRLKAAATLSIVVLRVSFSMLGWFICQFRLGVEGSCRAARGGIGAVEGDLRLRLVMVEGHGLTADVECAVPGQGKLRSARRRDREQPPFGIEGDLCGENFLAETGEGLPVAAADDAHPAGAA